MASLTQTLITEWFETYDDVEALYERICKTEEETGVWDSDLAEQRDDLMIGLARDAAAIFKQMQDAENTPEPVGHDCPGGCGGRHGA